MTSLYWITYLCFRKKKIKYQLFHSTFIVRFGEHMLTFCMYPDWLKIAKSCLSENHTLKYFVFWVLAYTACLIEIDVLLIWDFMVLNQSLLRDFDKDLALI